MIAGASAVEMGTVHLAEPKAGVRIERELLRTLDRLGANQALDLVGTVGQW